MKVGVNSRIYTSEYTGIQNYIKGVYQAILKTDKKSEYVFFQFDGSKKLGENTEIMKLPNNYLGYVLFDNFLVNNLVKKSKVDLFHGASNILPIYKVKGALLRGKKTVDIGCGYGSIEMFSPDTVGVDFSDEALEIAKRNGIKKPG